MNENSLFVEETTDTAYVILWKEGTPQEAISFLRDSNSVNRLELWSKAHAQTEKGFAPLAYRKKNSKKVMISHTFSFLYLGLTSH